MGNRNIAKAECTKCPRDVEVMEELTLAVEWGQRVICKECGASLKITRGNTCMHHLEDLSKGYCNGCAKDELLDNQM